VLFSGNSRGRCRKPSCPQGRRSQGPALPDSPGMPGDGAASITAPTRPGTLQRPPQAAGSPWEPEESRGSPGRDYFLGLPESVSTRTAKVVTSTCHDLPVMSVSLNPEIRFTEIFLKLMTPSIFTFSLSHFLDNLWHIKIYIFFHSELFNVQ